MGSVLGTRLRAALMVVALATPMAASVHAAQATSGGDAPVDLAALKGKVVYLDFWASWCVPCRQSFPWMNDMHRKYEADGLVVLAVNMDQVRADADGFLRQYPAQFRVAFDPAGRTASGFKLRGMPTSALIGRDGKVLLLHEGFKARDQASLEQSIRDALH
jgi:thiol-disulfide isomerase/thioredoxin